MSGSDNYKTVHAKPHRGVPDRRVAHSTDNKIESLALYLRAFLRTFRRLLCDDVDDARR